MKLRYILPVTMFACAAVFTTSCVKDLEVSNINPQEVSDFNEDYIFNKIYGNLVLTGQIGPNGDSDLDDIDTVAAIIIDDQLAIKIHLRSVV